MHRNIAWNLAGQGEAVFVALVAILRQTQVPGGNRFGRIGILALGWLVTGYLAMFNLGNGRSAIRQTGAHGCESLDRGTDVFRSSLKLHALMGLCGGMLLEILALLLALGVLVAWYAINCMLQWVGRR
jgi:hypothetical protein